MAAIFIKIFKGVHSEINTNFRINRLCQTSILVRLPHPPSCPATVITIKLNAIDTS